MDTTVTSTDKERELHVCRANDGWDWTTYQVSTGRIISCSPEPYRTRASATIAGMKALTQPTPNEEFWHVDGAGPL